MNSDSERPRDQRTRGAAASGPVLLASLYDPVEAEIIVAKLRSAGIAAFCRHESASVVYGLTVDGLGQQDIMVRAEDLEEARAALEVTEEVDGEE
jgi:hypothetical protein